MQFDTALYAVFLIAVFFASWALVRHVNLRFLLLLGASYFFYASWNWKFLALILASTVLDWCMGRSIHATDSQARKKLFLTCSLVGNLGLLGFFKYFNFFAESWHATLEGLGISHGAYDPWNILLPVGISFYTFQTLSYTLDIYRGDMEPTRSFTRFALFVAFFPQLVAGPIVRARELLPQFDAGPRRDGLLLQMGLFRILVGLVKKVALSDGLGDAIVDDVFASPEAFGAVDNWLAVYAYAFQMYFDFSAYTDIAIGSAALIGYTIPENFDRPYLAATPQEFWRKWHLTLVRWMQDYVFFPMGGSKRGPARTAFNIIFVWFLVGLWHGAAWRFVTWGLFHGVLLVVARLIVGRRNSKEFRWRPLWIAVTFHLVCYSMVVFRCADLEVAGRMTQQLLDFSLPARMLSPELGWLLGLSFLTHMTPKEWIHERLRGAFVALPSVVQAVALLAAAGWLTNLSYTHAVFLYFQF